MKDQMKVIVMMIGVLTLSMEAKAEFKNQLNIGAVSIAKSNAVTEDYAGYHKCDTFKGTLENNSVWVTPSATGGSGNYKHTLVWRLGGGYEGYDTNEQQYERNVRDGNSFNIFIPGLKDEVPYVQQSILLITKDLSSGEMITTEKTFPVSRGVILAPTANAALANKNCMQRYPAYQSTVGVLSNGSTNLSQLIVNQSVQHIWETTKGSSWGFYISPFSWLSFLGFSLGDLVTFNRNYFTSVSKQTTESVEVSADYQLSPGDFMQIFTQKTRYVSNYDATVVGACGETKVFPGAYKLQWWGFSYHAVPVNPFDSNPPNLDNIGAKPMNNCPAELTQGSDDGKTLPFYQTNL